MVYVTIRAVNKSNVRVEVNLFTSRIKAINYLVEKYGKDNLHVVMHKYAEVIYENIGTYDYFDNKTLVVTTHPQIVRREIL